MDDASLLLVSSLWPDVAEPFARVVPDGCLLVRALDDWTAGDGALRVRAIELARGPSCPSLEELVDEAYEDAMRRGWTPLDEEGSALERVLEIEGVLLRVKAGARARAGGEQPVLSVAFHQPWPPDAGAPVETSEAFQLLVRKTLALRGAPARLIKDLTVDPARSSRSDVVRERVDLPEDPRLLARFAALGFTFDEALDAWTHRTTAGESALLATVRELFATVRVDLVKTRLSSPPIL